MFKIVPITEDLLAELGAELGGCDFTAAEQRAFLSETGSCDVQAAPGNGKTTLLTAKLALLSRSWARRDQGVCVISHTNAARTEVENQIAKHATASRLMSYPHFTGTVTAFINQFLALPYLRGLGWCIRQIDDDAFAAEALKRYPYYWALKKHAKHATMKVESWVKFLDLDPAFEDASSAPDSLTVRHKKGQHRPHTDCGKALAKLKADMVKSGLYRYADLTALAWRAVRATPNLASRLRARFPLVILDEAQDTNGEQLKLLEHIFKHNDTAFQRLGDSNQSLYEDVADQPTYWMPVPESIPLDDSRRFGAEIAGFASRLTARRPQTIVGTADRPSSRVIILFDEKTIGSVLSTFANEVREHWGVNCGGKEVWAVASRHAITGKPKGVWKPKSLVDYHSTYRSDAGAREKAYLFCHQMQKAAVHHDGWRPPAEVMEMLATGLAGIAKVYRWKSQSGSYLTARNLWSTLAHRDPSLPRKVRKLLFEHVLRGKAPWQKDAWDTFINALCLLFGPLPEEAESELVEYCSFIAEEKVDLSSPEKHSTKQVDFGDLTIRLGSIHSVKGKSVDGILVLESEVWKGRAKDQHCNDLATVLPRAFGITDQPLTGIAETAAINLFVGVTRPREILGLAVRKSEVTEILAPATAQGWKLVDLVALAADGGGEV